MNYKESLKVPSLRSLSFEALSNFFEHFRPNNDLYVGHLWWRIARSFQTISYRKSQHFQAKLRAKFGYKVEKCFIPGF